MNVHSPERVGLYSLLLNLGLAVLKASLSLASGSLALAADAIDSATDSFASLAVWLGLHFSERRSRDFPFGLYKLENVASVVVAIFIFLAAYEVGRAALQPPSQPPRLRGILLAGAALPPIASLLFAGYVRRAGRETGSPSLLAEARHRLIDASSSALVFLALVGTYLGLQLDRVAAAILALFIAWSGWEILRDAMRVLLDASVDRETLERARAALLEDPQVAQVTSIAGRNSGRYRFLAAEVAVRADSLDEAHALSHRLEEEVKSQLGRVDRIRLHLEPVQRPFIRYAALLDDAGGTLSSTFGEAPYLAIVDVDRHSHQEIEREIIPNLHARAPKGRGALVAELLAARKPDVVLLRHVPEGPGPAGLLRAAGVEMRAVDAGTLDAALREAAGRPPEPAPASQPAPPVAITCHPIGHVENEWKDSAPPEAIRATESRLVIHPEYAEGLEGLEPDQHLTVVFHFHRAQGYSLQQHPRGDESRPLRGVFSICSPLRPNHLGVSFPRLLRRDGNVLHVIGLDALDGSPILDLKPFVAPGDERPKAP